MLYILLSNCWEEKYLLSFSHPQTHILHGQTLYILYTFYLKLLKLSTSVSPWSFISGMQMPWAQTLRDLSPHLSLHTSACALVSACCSFLPSFSQRVSHGTWDSPTCPSLPLTHMLLCMQIHKLHAHAEGGWDYSAAFTVAVLDATLTLILSAFLGPNNPVCSRPCTVSAPWASTICTLSLLDSDHCGGALLEAIESDLIPTLAFCQQRLHSDKRNGSSRQTNLLLYVSCRQIQYVQDGLELCFSCQKQVWITAGPATTPPEWSLISSQHCHKINTSSAIALCFLTCLAAHSDVPCPLVLCPTPFLL